MQAKDFGIIFIAPYKCELMFVAEVHSTAATDGSAVTLQLERLQGTEALDAGDSLLASTVDLKGTANTTVFPALVKTNVRILNRGDRIAAVDSGTLTDLSGVEITLVVNPIGQGHYRNI